MSLSFIFEGSDKNVQIIEENFGTLTKDKEYEIIENGNNSATSISIFIDGFKQAAEDSGYEFIIENGKYKVKVNSVDDFDAVNNWSAAPPVNSPYTNFYKSKDDTPSGSSDQVKLVTEQYNGYITYSETWYFLCYTKTLSYYNDYWAKYKTDLEVDYEDQQSTLTDVDTYYLKKSERKFGGAETSHISIPIYFYYTQETQEEEPDPIIPTEIGSFPVGVGADYMVLLCKTDPTFVSEQTQENLNNYANDYIKKITGNDNFEAYYGKDSSGIYVLVSKNSVDLSGEILQDWEDLYPNEQYHLNNSIAELNEENYYKVYLTGRCQIAQFDDSNYVLDQGGSTEVPEYNFPNGYYVIVGRSLRLFLLTDINTAKINLERENVIFDDGTTLGYTPGITYSYNDRKIFNQNSLYLYKGHRVSLTTEDLDIGPNSLIIQGASNLRQVNVSDTITSIGHFAGQANPDNGFFMSENLTYIGKITMSYTAGTKVYINSTKVTEIAENAFYNEDSGVSTNLKLYFCTDWKTAKEKDTLSDGYIAPSFALLRVGAQAFYGLKSSAVNLTACSNLQYLGKECFAMAAACKDFYYLITQLSQRSGVSDNLIYLPDGCDYNAAVGTTLTYNSSFYEQDTYKTFGEFLSGYKLNPRDREVDLI